MRHAAPAVSLLPPFSRSLTKQIVTELGNTSERLSQRLDCRAADSPSVARIESQPLRMLDNRSIAQDIPESLQLLTLVTSTPRRRRPGCARRAWLRTGPGPPASSRASTLSSLAAPAWRCRHWRSRAGACALLAWNGSAAMQSRRRSPTCSARSSGVSGMTMTNSSPPTRQARSMPRVLRRKRCGELAQHVVAGVVAVAYR